MVFWSLLSVYLFLFVDTGRGPPSSVNKQEQVALKVMIKTQCGQWSIWFNQLLYQWHWKLWSKHHVSFSQFGSINWCNLRLACGVPCSSVNKQEQVDWKLWSKHHVSYGQFGSINWCNLSLERRAPPSSVNKQEQVALKVMIKTPCVLWSNWFNQLM